MVDKALGVCFADCCGGLINGEDREWWFWFALTAELGWVEQSWSTLFYVVVFVRLFLFGGIEMAEILI